MGRNTEEMYANEKPWRLFFIVALPGMISMFAMSIYSIIEGAFIGHTLGQNAFAAINIAMPLVMINFSLGDLIGVGASVPISIALGRKDHTEANNAFSCSVILIFITSIIMGILMFFLATPLAQMMGADGVLLDTSVKYLRTFAFMSPLSVIFFAMDNYLKISGYVKYSMCINILCNVINIALLAFFLLFRHMDVTGAALATSTSFCICSLLAMIPFLANKALLKFKKPKFSLKLFKQIAACGSPVFLSNISGRIASIIMNIALMTIGARVLGENGGTTAVAIYAVLMYSSDLCWPLMYGISDSLAPSIGYNWGAKNLARVKKLLKCAFTGTFVVGIVSTSLLFFFPRFIASLFADKSDILLLEMAPHAIQLFCFAYVFRWIVVTSQGFFSAVGKPLFATFIAVATSFAFPVMLIILLQNFGLDGIWFNFVGVNFLSAALSVALLIYFFVKLKKDDLNV